jgi:hypothetical protein
MLASERQYEIKESGVSSPILIKITITDICCMEALHAACQS